MLARSCRGWNMYFLTFRIIHKRSVDVQPNLVFISMTGQVVPVPIRSDLLVAAVDAQ